MLLVDGSLRFAIHRTLPVLPSGPGQFTGLEVSVRDGTSQNRILHNIPSTS